MLPKFVNNTPKTPIPTINKVDNVRKEGVCIFDPNISYLTLRSYNLYIVEL